MEAEHLSVSSGGASSPDPGLDPTSWLRSVRGVVGVGVDLVEVARIAGALQRRPGLVDRLFTEGERRYCESARTDAARAQRFAVRFAAKEAAVKAVGAGLPGRTWHEVEVVRGTYGEPGLRVNGRVAAVAAERGGARWLVSLTHTTVLAQAVVLLVHR